MDPCQKEALGLKVGDFIIWRDEAVEVEGQPAVVSPGMKGKVISLHDGFHLDVAEVAPIPPRAMVQFENGILCMHCINNMLDFGNYSHTVLLFKGD